MIRMPIPPIRSEYKLRLVLSNNGNDSIYMLLDELQAAIRKTNRSSNIKVENTTRFLRFLLPKLNAAIRRHLRVG